MSGVLSLLDRLPADRKGSYARLMWAGVWISLLAGIAARVVGSGFLALYLFAAGAVFLALALPFTYALVSPLFAGLVGWLVDMLPLVLLVGWATVFLRWAIPLLLERRWPLGDRWKWLPIALVVWTAIGVVVVDKADLKGFALILGMQGIASGVVLACVDRLRILEDRIKVLAALLVYMICLSGGVFLQWSGVDLEGFQDRTVAERAEAAYGLDAFPNNLGMIKWARSTNSGLDEFRKEFKEFAADTPGLPEYAAFQPKFQAFSGYHIVRFDGSALAFADELEGAGVDLIHDSVGLAPANTVPRMRSFPRNALTFAGVGAALFFPAFALLLGDPRRRRLAWAGVVAALFGTAFSLARGAWIAVIAGLLYLWIDGRVDRSIKWKVTASFLAGAVILSGTYLIKYGVDPVTGRAGGGASVNTRDDLYADTIGAMSGIHYVLGYGVTQSRSDTGTTREGTVGRKYVPRAGTHSTYLNYLFRTGGPGALLILALYGVSFLFARSGSRVLAGRERLVSLFLAAGVVTAGAHAVILSLYVEPIYMLVISLLLGLAVAGMTDLGSPLLPWKARAKAVAE